MTVETIARTIQLMLAPIVMVTSCAILVNGMLQRYGEINDRMRAMTHERLELLQTGEADTPAHHLAGGRLRAERLTEIDLQLPGLLRRHHLLHNGMLALYGSILCLVASMFVIGWAALRTSPQLARVALFVFLAATLVMLAGVLLVAIEIRASQREIHFEVRRVVALRQGRGHGDAPAR
jgi:Protein of unknown function (DUF2721)